MKPLLVTLAICSLATACNARTLVGTHPSMYWLRLSPDGHWLDSGSASNEGPFGGDADTWRHDLRRGGHINLGYSYRYTWLSNGLVAAPAGTEADNIKTSIGMEGQVAPVISLSRPGGTKPLRIYRDQMFERDPYWNVRLSQNKRQLWIYSQRWRRCFDVRNGRLISRTQWPLSRELWESTWEHISPDGRWLVAVGSESKPLVQLYGQDGKLKRSFPGRSVLSDNFWLSPTLFALERKWTPAGSGSKEHTSTEFYDATTGRRLWVLADRLVSQPVETNDIPGKKVIWVNDWRPYNLIQQQNAVIVCGKNIWVWRDARTGQVLRSAIRPKAWTRDQPQPKATNLQVHGDFYYWSDTKGRIWRERFQFV